MMMKPMEDMWDIKATRILEAKKKYHYKNADYQKYLARELRSAYNAGENCVRQAIREALGLDDRYEEKE
jgi:hypothetical protein